MNTPLMDPLGRTKAGDNKKSSISLPDDIDPGIRRMVEIFNAKGLVTEMSCEGHRDHQSGYCHRAYVTFEPAAFQKYVETKRDRLERFLCEAVTISLMIRYYGVKEDGEIYIQPAIEFPTHWNENGVLARPNEGKLRRYWMDQWEMAAKKFL